MVKGKINKTTFTSIFSIIRKEGIGEWQRKGLRTIQNTRQAGEDGNRYLEERK